MNREILFKGFHPDENSKDRVFINGEWINGKWVEGNHLYDEITDKHYIVPFGNINESQKVGQEGCCYCVGFEVIPETVGQYTGLTDKNGKKIFKNYICNVCRGADIETGVVYYDERVGAWGVRYNEKECNLLFDIFTNKDTNVWIEVIGNIHDNPELLEVAE